MRGLEYVVIILITLTMIIVKLIGCTYSSYNEADEGKIICSFRVLKSDYTKCLKIHEREENYTGFCCSNKLHLQCSSQP